MAEPTEADRERAAMADLTLLERWLIRRIAKRRVLDRAIAQARADRDFWRAAASRARQDAERIRRAAEATGQ